MNVKIDTVVAPFLQVEEDENGKFQNIKFVNDENFNFAYDIVDKIAKKDVIMLIIILKRFFFKKTLF